MGEHEAHTMELSELNPTEQLVLVGLAKAVVHADHEVTQEETRAIRTLADEVGTEAWNLRVSEARTRLATAEQLFELARKIVRLEAREAIYGALRQLAESDELAESEVEILTWVADVWQLGGTAADIDEDEEEDEDDTTFDGDFVLFDPDEDQ